MSLSPVSPLVSLSAIALSSIMMCSSTTVLAQTVAPLSIDERKVGVVSQLTAEQRIRVATSNGEVFEGRYVRLERESLVLYLSARRDAPGISLSRIDTLWVRERDHRKGLVLGALTGGVIGAIGVTLLAVSITRGTSEHCNCADTVVGTVGVSSLLGAAIGAVTGWPGWGQRWPE